jgi:hypothetical protein
MIRPICDECGVVREETVHAITVGEVYRFCSDGCRRRFRFARLTGFRPRSAGVGVGSGHPTLDGSPMPAGS